MVFFTFQPSCIETTTKNVYISFKSCLFRVPATSCWLNHPFEQYARQNGFIFPKDRDENKRYLKPPPRKFHLLLEMGYVTYFKIGHIGVKTPTDPNHLS